MDKARDRGHKGDGAYQLIGWGMRLDAHQHFWIFNQAEYPWIKPDGPLGRNFLPADLRPLLVESRFDGSIAVQARQSLEETRWLLELAERDPLIRGVVGWVDLRSERVEEDLRRFAAYSTFVGVRHVLQDELDDNFMLGPEFMRGIGKLAQFDLTYDILIFPRQLSAAIKLATRFPNQPFVLDHIAKPHIKAGTISPWREHLFELAKCSNVMCKLSGMVTEANWEMWKHVDFQPYLDVVLEAFGPGRLMFGSDWPVCLLAGSYERVLGLVHDRIASLPESARKDILGGTAERFYLRRRAAIA
jgi:L-fuconolactonase